MVEGHSVDIPVTNLDEDDDDFSTPSEDLDANVFRDDFDLEHDNSPFVGASLASKMKNAISKITSRGYSRIPKAYNIATNGIELQEAFHDNDSFDLSDDEFINRGQKFGPLHSVFGFLRKSLTYFMILALLIVVIVLGVLLSKKNGSSKPILHQKELLSNGTNFFYPTTILISLDGFHPHYISSKLTPTLHDILKKGYGPPFMKPSFPSSTFPNHWTIATGLHPQSHGIVGNTFYDPASDRQFINVIPEKSLDPYFWGGEPIWSTAELQGVRSAIHMFPGSEVEFKTGNPSEVDKFNKTETLEVKSDRIFEWLDRDISKRPELIVGYVPTIDTLGHRNGIQGEALEKGLKYVDSFIKSLTKGIENRNATEIVNLVIVSDHGMAPTSNERLVYLDDLVNTTKIQHTDGWPLFGLRPFPEFTPQEIYEELKASYKEDSGYSIYLREELPKEWNFGGSKRSEYYDRIAPVWVVPDVGYSITTHDDMERKGGNYNPKGVHGYNNSEVLMRAIFLGTGPYFKSKSSNGKAFKVEPFQNTEVYNILCESLNLTPAINNGTSEVISEKKLLDSKWRDDVSYPNVKFDIGGILKEKSTYDELFRAEKAKETTTLEPTKEATGTEGDNESKTKEEGKGTKTEEKTKGTQVKEEGKKTETPKEIKTKDEGHKTKTANEKSKETEEHKGFFESITEDLEELAEDIKDEFEDLGEDIEDAFEDAYHKVKGDKKGDD